jgi:hypothetical protein
MTQVKKSNTMKILAKPHPTNSPSNRRGKLLFQLSYFPDHRRPIKTHLLGNAFYIQLRLTEPKNILLEYSCDGKDIPAEAVVQQNLLVNNIKTRVDIMEGTLSNTRDMQSANGWAILIPGNLLGQL